MPPQSQYPGLQRVRDQMSDARAAQATWRRRDVKQRVGHFLGLRGILVDRAGQLADLVKYPGRNGHAETIPAELLPLADACAFLYREGSKILAPQRPSNRSRPFWASGVQLEIHRAPLGVVLIIGAANYPLLLAGVQVIQALAAGNAVLIKPGRDAGPLMKAFAQSLTDAGIPSGLIQLLPEEPAAAQAAMELGVDKVVLTGSAQTGRAVLRQLADSLTPATMELSGCDAVFILPDADLERAATALAFGLLLNGGGSCIAPRRVFVHKSASERFLERLCFHVNQRAADLDAYEPQNVFKPQSDPHVITVVNEAISDGARIAYGGLEHDDQPSAATIVTNVTPEMALFRTDVFAPILSVVPVDSMERAIEFNRQCPYRLGATLFGDEQRAKKLAESIDAGCIVINDVIAPTADPRVPFGGSGESGFGVTRGAAGLLEMTRVKTLMVQRRRWLPHLERPTAHDANLLGGMMRMLHGQGLMRRIAGLRKMISAIIAQRKAHKTDKPTT